MATSLPPGTPNRKIRTNKAIAFSVRVGLLAFVFMVLLIIDGIFGPPPDFGPSYSVNNHSPLSFVAAPGRVYTIHIIADSSIEGIWAAPQGLQLVFDNILSSPQLVVKPTSQTWGDQLSASCKGGSCNTDVATDLACTIVVPSLSGPGDQTVSGHITGTIIYPKFHEGFIVGSNFTNESATISVPLKVRILTLQHFAQLSDETNRILLIAILSFFLSNIPIGLFAWRVGRNYSRRHGISQNS